MDADPSVLKEIVETFHKRRDLVLSYLNKIPGVKCNVPTGAFYLFPDVSAYFGTKDGRLSSFFSVGALFTTFLILLSSYLFGLYIENFSTKNVPPNFGDTAYWNQRLSVGFASAFQVLETV